MGTEKFCPNCGQANKGNHISFKSFISDIFDGLLNFDAKFWRTIIPLLIKPGKVTKDYIEGKRQRYSNPFRFYLTVSVIFFLILGINNGVEKFKKFSSTDDLTKKDTIKSTSSFQKGFNDAQNELTDTQKAELESALNNPLISKKTKEKILEEIEKEQKAIAADTSQTKSKKRKNNEKININFGDNNRLNKFSDFYETHKEMPDDEALDSLGYEHTFWNRFWYDRGKAKVKFAESEDSRKQYLNQALSYGSVALFVFLPIFTLFLKLFYIRRKFTYVDHLVFVFHCQTVFFMLLSIFFILNMFIKNEFTGIFMLLFLIYLFIALKVFYRQGYLKTFIKFILLNLTYLFISIFGIVLVLFLSFALI